MTMTRMIRNHLMLLGLSCVCLMQIGCGSSRSITFTNVSDSWLNVNYFVASPETGSDSILMISEKAIQVSPGQTATYSLSRNSNYAKDRSSLVHIRVRPVTPSWEEVGTEYWMELLTNPPVTIVAAGTGDRFEFMTGNGALALIPASQLKDSRFAHKTRTELAEELAREVAEENLTQAQTNASEANK